ncbi:ADP-ribosylation factor-like protein 8 [Nosema granulosis]|uniref:ADP-ribosylation factor-like protein 8 n=1 Tax=Nosema granulosis TaxID=83296 RepID=A0A9P6H077_9MICR|nr:ADP-ribosylation factor-like protein 8 [Nosema granulosis]
MSGICSKIKNIFKYLYTKFFVTKFKVLVLGLSRTTKSCLVPAIFENVYPTKKYKSKIKTTEYREGNVCYVVYDIPGSRKFRIKWDYYYRRCDVLLYCVDLTWPDEMWERAKEELRSLLYRNIWMKKNLLVLGTKNDLEEALECKDMILKLDLLSITDREIACYSVSAKEGTNVDIIKPWLMDQFDLKYGESKLVLY